MCIRYIEMLFLDFFLLGVACGYPATLVQQLTQNEKISDSDNSINPFDDEFSELDIYFKGNLTNNLNTENYTKTVIPFNTEFSDPDEDKNILENINRTLQVVSKTPVPDASNTINPLTQTNKNRINNTRNFRQDGKNEFEEKESQEQGSSEEEDGNMLTGLLSAFLGGLSRPDGSIDIEAILGLLGSLSTQNDDGTYDFNGLTQLLRGFFGGDTEGGGGSDIGAFAGGILGALIRGVANPPGPKGAGILAGKVVTGILPALSAPEPKDDANGTHPWKKEPALDSGSFLTGFIGTALGSGGNGMAPAGGPNPIHTLIKLVISAVTGIFSASSSLSSSASSSKSDWN